MGIEKVIYEDLIPRSKIRYPDCWRRQDLGKEKMGSLLQE